MTSYTTKVSEKSIVLPFPPYESIRDHIWPCRKIGQRQPLVIIWNSFVVLEYPMLHTNLQGHLPLGSREEDFLRFFPCMGMVLTWAKGSHLNKLGSTRAPDAAYQVSRSSAFWFRRRGFLKVFTIYGHGGHLGHVTRTVSRSVVPGRPHMKFGFNRPSGFRGDVWKCWHTYGRQWLTYTISSPMSLKAQMSL